MFESTREGVLEMLSVVLIYRCSNGYLSAYLRGQDITKELPDEVFCGRTLPDPLVTSNPRLLLLFNTSNARITGHGFKARFQFLTGSSLCFIHSFILETYIAPLQDTTTQRRSQPSHV